MTRPRDLPVGGRLPHLVWHKRRWVCDEPACPRGSFTESVPQIPARSRLTCTLREAAWAAVADGGRTIVQSARDRQMPWPVVCAAFTAHAVKVLPDQPGPVRVLGIDESGRPHWVFDELIGVWRTSVDRWHVGFVDLSDGQGLLGQIEGRTAKSVSDWLDARGQEWKDGVEFVAIDMCTIFKAAIRETLPQAILVVDHFHLVQLANQALTEVRRRVTIQARGRRGRKGNREWELRNRLTRSAARMHARHIDPMVLDLHKLPAKIGLPVLAEWRAKQDLLDLLALARTRPDRHVISHRSPVSTFLVPTLAWRSSNAWPPRSRSGGRRSSRSCTRA